MNSHAILAECYAKLGMFAEGSVFGEEGRQIAEAVAHPGSLMLAYYGVSLLALRQGGLPRGLPLLERAVSICQDADLPGFFPPAARWEHSRWRGVGDRVDAAGSGKGPAGGHQRGAGRPTPDAGTSGSSGEDDVKSGFIFPILAKRPFACPIRASD